MINADCFGRFRLILDPDDLEVRDSLRPRLEGLELPLYREKAESALRQLMESSLALQKVRQGVTITSDELTDLSRRLLLCDPELTVEKLLERFAGQQKSIEGVLRSIVGMEAVAVDAHFRRFIGKNPLNSHQLRFLDWLKAI